MKILFVRHGQSQDDLENRYGGWDNFPLTSTGVQQLQACAATIADLQIPFEKIFSSPLQRAYTSAEIISSTLQLPYEIFEYVKEQNKYGVLTGMEKNMALEKYPSQVKRLTEEKYVDGSERYGDLKNRVKKALSWLEKSGLENIIVVTHGNFLGCLFKEFAKLKITKKEDGGWVLVTLKKGKIIPEKANGIEYKAISR